MNGPSRTVELVPGSRYQIWGRPCRYVGATGSGQRVFEGARGLTFMSRSETLAALESGALIPQKKTPGRRESDQGPEGGPAASSASLAPKVPPSPSHLQPGAA